MFLPFFIDSRIDYHLRIYYYWNFFNFYSISLYLSFDYFYYSFFTITGKGLDYFTWCFLSVVVIFGEAGLAIDTLDDSFYFLSYAVPKNLV